MQKKIYLIRSPCNLPTQFPHSFFFIDMVGFEPITSLHYNHGCQNLNLDPTILQFYDLTYPKQFGSFKDLSNHSGSYDSNDSK